MPAKRPWSPSFSGSAASLAGAPQPPTVADAMPAPRMPTRDRRFIPEQSPLFTDSEQRRACCGGTGRVGWGCKPQQESVGMETRRVFVLASILSLPLVALAQQPGAGFVGDWQGQVPGIGDARLVVTSVRPDGQVEGRMEFALQAFMSTFGDKADSAKRTNRGVVSGSALTIESALGGKYELSRTGDQLSGPYTRGTTMNVAVSFKKT